MRKILNINSNWKFKKDTTTIPTSLPKDWEAINLPHTWNAIDGQDGGNDYFRGHCVYAKEILKSELPQTDKCFLEIEGANSIAVAYFNGKKIATHKGGYSTWRVELEDIKDVNVIAIDVDNSANDEVYPQQADFTFYGGLYRSVNIIGVNNVHFDLMNHGSIGIKATPIVESKSIEVELFIKNQTGKEKVLFEVLNNKNEVVLTQSAEVSANKVTLNLKEITLWHGRKNPYLYTLRVAIVNDKSVLDHVSTRLGFRTYKVCPENGFILNGEEYPLRGVSRHQDRWGVGNALSKEHHKEDIDLINEMGATTIRLAHYQHDQYFYDLCDESGLVIWAEIPYISRHMPNGRQNTIDQMKDLISQNYHHISIICWGLSNEITMATQSDPDLLENHKILNDLCHSMDSTRLTTIACVSMTDMDDPYVYIPDLVSYNHYFGWYGGNVSMNGPWFDEFRKKNPNIPVGCSEYGCEGLNWHNSNPKQGDYSEEYQAYYHEELIKQFFSRKYMWSTHCWNMFDFGCDGRNEGGENGQNHKGLVTIDRKYKKDAFYAYKAWLSDEPFIHLCSKRYVDRVEAKTTVKVYSNQKEVELFVNGISVGKKQAADHFFYFEVDNVGKSEIKAVSGNLTDTSTINKVEVFNEAYKLKENGIILNWFDITEPEGFFSLNDSIDDIMKVQEGAMLVGKFMLTMFDGKDGESKIPTDDKQREKMMTMLGGFSVIRLVNMASVMDATVSKESLLQLNKVLNGIKKPQ
ncbi:MAG: glycoside hydrolase family 2 protein [Anaeroplasmataceae bacterium]